jgi:RND family efflux transporter MFP subunit
MMHWLLRAGFSLAVVMGLALVAQAQTEPTVLVQLTTLRKGSLPQIVTAYGRVQAGAPASQTIMAPLSAVVESVDVRPGQTVAQGAPLLRLAPSPPAAASYTQAESTVRVATDLVTRTRSMVAQHLATAQQVADAEKARSDARATLDALKAQGADGPKILRAPFPAIVTALSTTPGAIVAEGATLIQLARPQGLVLQVGLVPDEASSVAAGDNVTITPIGGGPPLQGTVSLRGSVVQATDGLIPVDVTIPLGKLFVGEMAEANITTGQLTGYVVPHEAVLVNDQGQTYVVQSMNLTARKVPVHVVGAQGVEDVIAGTLDPAAPLVVAGNHQLDDGMKMRVADAGHKAAR